VLAALGRQVSQRSYRVLHMRYIDGRTVADIAAVLELTPGQVRSRLHRMKQKFQLLFDLYANTDFPG
jgi:DNA-directed RNA polymerase specialized sigma24 family protein